MKEQTRGIFPQSTVRRGEFILLTMRYALYMAIGLITAAPAFGGKLFAGCAVFAVAFLAGGGASYLAASAAGAALGYWLFQMHPPFSQSAGGLIAIGLAGILTAGLLSLSLPQRVFAFPVAAGSSLAGGLADLFLHIEDAGVADYMGVAVGAVLSAGCAYFYVHARNISYSSKTLDNENQTQRKIYFLSPQDAVSVLVCVAVLAGCLSVKSEEQNFLRWIGQGLGVLAVLSSSAAFREIGGAAMGAAVGCGVAIGSGNPLPALVYIVGGLLAGVFGRSQPEFSTAAVRGSKAGRKARLAAFSEHLLSSSLPAAGGFALATAIYVLLLWSDEPEEVVQFAIVTLVAAGSFLGMPPRFWLSARERLNFGMHPERLVPQGAGTDIYLKQTAQAVRRVGTLIEEVSKGLDLLDGTTEQSILAMTAHTACEGCSEYSYCWSDKYAETSNMVNTAVNYLRADCIVDEEVLAALRAESGHTTACRDLVKFGAMLNRAFDTYAMKEKHKKQELQLRLAAAEQFGALSSFVEDMRERFSCPGTQYVSQARAAAEHLLSAGWRLESVNCAASDGGKAHLRILGTPPPGNVNRDRLRAAMSRVTGIAFGVPILEEMEHDGAVLLDFEEEEKYELKIGAVQLSAKEAEWSGDYLDYFPDSKGNTVLVISDGMGTGGVASIQSALATEVFSSLVRAGVSMRVAFDTVNTALMLKSGEESLATMDVAAVNLYTGEVSCAKAGGTVSYYLRGGKAEAVELKSLPAGILRSLQPAERAFQLDSGDILVLLSDGLFLDHHTWIGQMLEQFAAAPPKMAEDENPMQVLAELLTEEAVRRRGGVRADDITVLCAQLFPKRVPAVV
ncbi:MAG: SpoIIE family protein phosphatase [Oscillospiraceae bacterium]|jgi:stage II sporulation protein E|nr:SpoIIE family protein phosphatase [Oscillospiraceae bacterium]